MPWSWSSNRGKALETAPRPLRDHIHSCWFASLVHCRPLPTASLFFESLPLACVAHTSPYGLLLLALFWCQEMIDLFARGPADLGRSRPRLPLWQGRICAQVLKLLVPRIEDGPDLVHLIVRQV